ncbi:hypothetical protein [Caldimonas aquatica]|uniref:Uncharacterized protein n=1 Tax=Caldimonas aquatica TaxID=376175 RepID=A0ABY6MUY6_9BURK|nr:hypothetical protein [Schlegelella aquatica]UZD55827.1 hypothetical protein OMP39_04395 [Schlegelella aquatica]
MFKKTCSSCHYFIRLHYPERAAPFSLEVPREARRRAAAGDLSWQRESESLACHRGIWDEGVGCSESSKIEQVSKLNRRGRCYYLPYQPGMLLPAAEKLQAERASQSRELQRWRIAVYSLVIAIAGLAAKLFIGGGD